MKSLIIFIAVLITVISASKVRFDNYKVYNLEVETQQQLNALREIENSNVGGYDFWQPPVIGRSAELMVPPSMENEFQQFIQEHNIRTSVKVNNVQSLIDNERPLTRAEGFDWTDYNTLEEIYAWLDELAILFPTIVTVETIGQSHQGRDIKAIRIAYPDNGGLDKPTIFIEANIHAREWITSATATWFINRLLYEEEDEEIMSMAENLNWYFIPVYNVDGFVYAHNVNRMWRKTRQNHATVCIGTDLNRNFNLYWGQAGTSPENPCAENFPGPRAFSEPEAVVLANYIEELIETRQVHIPIYIAFHSYGQYLLFPYGHDTQVLTADHDTMDTIANATRDEIALRYGTDYLAGTSSATLYTTSGTTVDYFYHNNDQIKVGYTFEFRDRRNGPYGFVLPADQIIPNCEEIMDGFKVLISEARRLTVLPPIS